MAQSRTDDVTTPEMIAAGVLALDKFDADDFRRNREALVEAVFRAMRDAPRR